MGEMNDWNGSENNNLATALRSGGQLFFRTGPKVYINYHSRNSGQGCMSTVGKKGCRRSSLTKDKREKYV